MSANSPSSGGASGSRENAPLSARQLRQQFYRSPSPWAEDTEAFPLVTSLTEARNTPSEVNHDQLAFTESSPPWPVGSGIHNIVEDLESDSPASQSDPISERGFSDGDSSSDSRRTPPQSSHYSSRVSYQSKTTPMKTNTANEATGHKSVGVLRDALFRELDHGPPIWIEGEDGGSTFAKEFADAQNIGDDAIKAFLKKSPLYTRKRWKGLKSVAVEGTKQYNAVVDIINSIIEEFHPGTKTRRAVARPKHYQHECKVGSAPSTNFERLHTTPDAVIAGCGGAVSAEESLPSDEILRARADYATCVTPVEMKCKKHPKKDQIIQLGVYVREVYVQCQNREQVYGLLITDEWIQLVKYDRTGLVRSDEIDIHADPYTFIRIIAGVSSPDDKKVGFMPYLRWENNEEVERVIALPSLMEPANNTEGFQERPAAVFRIQPQDGKLKPLFIRQAIVGRGTTCWIVVDEQGAPLVAKFAWRFEDREAEWTFLLRAKDLEGVAQIYAFCDNLARVSESRFWPEGSGYTDCILSCIIMHEYGGSVERFRSPKQLLWAIYDAVRAHRNLLLQGRILHRDISTRNILLGTSDTPGWRGVLIDLDLAIDIDRGAEVSRGFRTGTRMYQSIRVIEGEGHDYWDDLESFFYVLVWLLSSRVYSEDGVIEQCDVPPEIKKWEKYNDLDATNAKSRFTKTRAKEHKFLQETLAKDFLQLIDDLRLVIDKYQETRVDDEAFYQKYMADNGLNPEEYLRQLDPDIVTKEYDKFLKPIEEAIDRLEKGVPDPAYAAPTAPLRPLHLIPLPRSRSRSSQSLSTVPAQHRATSSTTSIASSRSSQKRPAPPDAGSSPKRLRSSTRERPPNGTMLPPSSVPTSSSARPRERSRNKARASDAEKSSASTSRRGRSVKKSEGKSSRSAPPASRNNEEENTGS